MKLSIVIPAFNESETLEPLIRRILDVDLGTLSREIIVVDDASTDNTPTVLRGLKGIRIISHPTNAGKGEALATGIRAATGDIVIFQDADLEYAPEDYPLVVQPILDGTCEAVMGSRFLSKGPLPWGIGRPPSVNHYIGNFLIRWITNLLYRKQFTDCEGCYKAFLRTHLLETPVEATGFEFDNELICKLLRKGLRVVEVPIQYHPRSYAEGKKITWRHGLIILWTIVKWRFIPLMRQESNKPHKLAA